MSMEGGQEDRVIAAIRGVTGGGGGGGGDASAANQATQITAEQAILAKIIAAPATSAKQDTQITAEQAILAKLLAAPATEAKQDTGNTSLASILAKTGVAAANLATGQVATSVAAATFVVARPTRRAVTLKNMSTSITVYYGPATVTTSNGMELKPGESQVVNWVGLIQVIAASGTPTVAYSDEYD